MGLYSAISHFTSQSMSIICSDPPSDSLVKELLLITAQISLDADGIFANYFSGKNIQVLFFNVKETTIVLGYNNALSKYIISISQHTWIYMSCFVSMYLKQILQLFGPWGWGKLSISFLPYKVFADRAKRRLSKEGSNKFMIFDVVDFGLLDSSSPVHSYRTLLFPHRQFAV